MAGSAKEFDARGRLQQLLDARGWNISELSQRAGLAQSTLAMMAARNNQPSLPTIRAVCACMDISLEQFFCETAHGYGDERDAMMQEYALLTADNQRIVRELVHAMAHPAALGAPLPPKS